MKKKLFTLLTLMLCVCSGAWAAVVNWKVGSTGPAVGTQFTYGDALKIAFGAMSQSKSDKDATNYVTGEANTVVTFKGTNYNFTHYATTSQTNGSSSTQLSANGSSEANYMAFVPLYSGTLIVVVQNSGGKTTYAYEDGEKKSGVLIGTDGNGTIEFSGEADLKTVTGGSSNYTGGIKFDVSAGKTYTISVSGSKGRWQGVIFDYVAGNPPTITTQPVGSSYEIDATAAALTIAAEAKNGGTLSYQWYRNTKSSTTDATLIEGATSTSYTPSTTTAGTTYYYCQVTEAGNKDVATSNIVAVEVNSATEAPTFKIYGHTVQLGCATEGAEIYYEMDNANVQTSNNKTKYTGAFIPTNSGTLYAYAVKSGLASSVVSQVINLPVVGEVVGGLLATLRPEASGTDYKENGYTQNGYIITTSGTLASDARGKAGYGFHFKTSGTLTVTAPASYMIQSIKIYGTSNDGSKVATVTAGEGATVISSPAELMPRDVTVDGVQTWSQIIISSNEPAAGNSVSFTLGRESRLYVEVYGKEVTETTITPAYSKITYVTTQALDFSNVSGLKAYVATGATAAGVTTEEVGAVPAGTPLLLKGTAGTEYSVPVAAEATAPATNLLRAGDGTTVFDGKTYDYLLYSDGKFYQIGSGTIAVGKAYLHLDSAPAGARSLNVIFGDEVTGIEAIASGTKADNAVYNLGGQRVAQPTKGLYIVNGKKVIIK